MSTGIVRLALAGAALITAASLGACSYPDPPAAPAAGSPSPAPAKTASADASPAADTRPKAPLTGAPADPSVIGRSAVAIAVKGSNPLGLDKADVVIEEESSPIRYVGLFQSQDSGQVGPLAQTRTSDIQALTLLRPVYGFRDGPNGMVDQVKRSSLLGLNSASRGESFMTRGPDIYASTTTLRAAAQAPAAKPLLVYGIGVSGPVPGGKATKQVVVTIPNRPTQTWRYDDAKALWTRVSGGPVISTRNLLVQVVAYKSVTLSHRYGGSDVSAKLFGTGTSVVMTGPQAITGTWAKPGLPQQTNFPDSASVPVRLAPGPSWLLLAPAGSTVTAG
jgi:hypothetical protein